MYGRAVVPVDMLGRQLQAQRRARYLKENPDAHFDGPLRSTLHDSKHFQYTDTTQEPEMYHKWVYPRGLKRLDLSHTKMVDYPKDLPTTLEHLELPFSLNYVAPQVGELVKLQSLKLNSPAMTTLPPELCLLTCLKALDLPYCPRMDNTLKVAFEDCLRIPGTGWRRPGHLQSVLKERLGRVVFVKPKPFFRPIVRKGRRKKPPPKPGTAGKGKRRKSQTTLQMERFGSKTDSPPPSPGKKPLGGAGGSSGKLGGKKKSMKKKKKKAAGDMSKDRDSDEDELTVEQLSYVRDLREWRDYNPPPQPPMPKDHLGLPLFDYNLKVDPSNWVIVGTDRKPNRRFVSPYEFLQFTQAKPNKHSIFEIDKKTLKVTVPTAL